MMQFKAEHSIIKKNFFAKIGAYLIVFAAIVVTNWRFLEFNEPRSDDIVLSLVSSSINLDWIRKGFSDYFYPYPEFADQYTNFIRPVVNLFFYITGLLNLGTTGRLLVLNYGFHAFNVLILLTISKSKTLPDRILIAFIFALAPAFWFYPTPVLPAYGPEIMSGTFVILALIFFISGKNIVGGICLAVALLTKEATIPFTAALIVYGIWIRNIKFVAIPAALLIGLLALRYLAFGTISGGVYAVSSFDQMILNFRRLFAFPNFYMIGSELRLLIVEGRFGLSYLFLLTNFVSLGLLAGYFWDRRKAIFHALVAIVRPTNRAADPVILAWLSCASALLFFILVGGHVRLSYTTLLAFLFVLTQASNNAALQIIKIILAIGHIIGFSNNLMNSQRFYESNTTINTAAIQLKQRVLAMSTNRPVYVINDIVTGFAKSSDFARLVGSSIDLRRGTSVNVDNCFASDLIDGRIQVQHDEKSVILAVTLPQCASFVFEGSSTDKIMAHQVGDWIVRNQHISYKFTRNGVTIPFTEINQKSSESEVTLITRVQDADVLYFDFGTKDWVGVTP